MGKALFGIWGAKREEWPGPAAFQDSGGTPGERRDPSKGGFPIKVPSVLGMASAFGIYGALQARNWRCKGVTVPVEAGSVPNPRILEMRGISRIAEPEEWAGNVTLVFIYPRIYPVSLYPSASRAFPKRADFSQVGELLSRECRVHGRDGCARRV